MQIVIVGSGVAGVTAATTIRENNPEAKISIYTDEKHLYYPRPKLYEILSGEAGPEDIYGFPTQWYNDKGIEVHLNRKAMDIDTAAKELVLEDATRVRYDKLLLANGGRSFVPPLKGVEKPAVFTLRTIQDALTIKEYAKNTKKAIIIGGGLIGLEFAASLRKLGQQVEVVEIFPRLLPMQLDRDGAAVLKDRIAALGIGFVLGVKTTEILGEKAVAGISLDNGQQLTGDFVLISAGVRLNADLAVKAGLKVNKGVVVDRYLQTSADDVYAAGDVAEFEGRVYGIIPAAFDQAKIAAMNMLEGNTKVYKGTIPLNTLKIVGIDLTSMGLVNPESPRYEEIRKIDQERGIYKKIVLDQGKIVGAILLGETSSVGPIKVLMDRGTDVNRYKDVILEYGFDFRSVVA